jgi:tripartite-type tricarboxylate transporter receptor subunit TctC
MKKAAVRSIVMTAFGIVFSSVVSLTAVGQSPDFYKGRNISLIVSTDSGTGYDLYARTIARHWPKYIPGQPAIIVQNMAGAGGLRAANLLYNVSSKDGLTIGMVQSNVPYEPLYENKQATFDPLSFNWLGTPGQETSTMIVWHTVPVRTLDEAKKRGLTLGATGAASTPAFYARVITALIGVPITTVTGYKNQNEIFLSMERGENEGSAGTFYSTMKANKPHWLAEKKIRILLQYGNHPNPELKEVPFAMDLIKDAESRDIMELAAAPLAIGRPLLAPPGVPKELVEILRKSVTTTFADSEYKADCAKQAIDCDSSLSGEAIDRILRKSYASPDSVRKRLLEIYSATGK